MRHTFFFVWAAPPQPERADFGSLGSPDFSRQDGWPSAGFASRLAD